MRFLISEIMALTTPGPYPEYGSSQVFANWTIRISGIKDYSDYSRSLDLKTGIHTTTYVANGNKYTTEAFCTYPDGVCVHRITTNGVMPPITVGLSNKLRDPGLLNTTCGDGWLRFKGVTQHGPPEGMKFDSITRALGNDLKTKCKCGGSRLDISAPKGQKSVVLVLGGGTNFDQRNGNAASRYSFKGEDPAAYVEKVTKDAAAKSYDDLLKGHLDDFQALEGAFSLELPDKLSSASRDTAKVIEEYVWDGPDDPWLDNMIFDYGRYLLISASRENSLPAGLQGRWVEKLNADWGADIHADINIEMNYWLAEQTGLSVTAQALYNYLELNLVPRGSDTAKLLYNAPGWVTHTEMNIFGWTAMKDAPYWASCES
jgi:alpha-L-fucosidase 2